MPSQLLETSASAADRLDKALAAAFPDVSRARFQALIAEGAVSVEGETVTEARHKVKPGNIVRVNLPEAAPALPQAEEMALHIVYEDKDLIVIDKPAGLVVHPGAGNETGTLVNALIAHCGDSLSGIGGVRRPGIVHRLDKDTSGALLIARTARAAAYFSKHFSGRSARKVYWALVVGVPEIADGLVDLPIAKQPGTGGEKMHVSEHDGQPSRSRYRVIERAGNRAAWVELQPLTGRTHQLRVHMAAIGHPIVGDGKYGGKEAFLTGGVSRKMHLHARRIRIPHPDEGVVDATAELPDHFTESMQLLGFDPSLGDRPLAEDLPPPSRAAQKAKAKAHAKTVRKARRGERRSRGEAKR